MTFGTVVRRRFKQIKRTAMVSLVCCFLPVIAGAQTPAPVNIPIANIPQQTQVWCWAAVAQQIIQAARGPANTPPQCALVAMANGAPPGVCCGMGNPQCFVTGSLPQIQMLIARFGGHFSTVAPPTDPMTLYRTLKAGHPIILAVSTGMYSAHVVVLRGMNFLRTPIGVEPVLIVNDPMSYFTQPVPFSRLIGIWRSAIVVH